MALWVRDVLARVAGSCFTFPVKQGEDADAGGAEGLLCGSVNGSGADAAPARRRLLLDPVIRVCGDFSMLHWVCGLTGGSDHGRCPFSVGCLLSQYPYPRYHTGTKQTRDMNAVSGQWELAVLNVANWAAGHGGACTFHEGEAFVSCPVCGRDVPYSSEVFKGSGVLYCRDPAC